MSEKQNIYIEDLNELKDENSFQLVGFKLGDEEYAIDVLKIQEIIRLIEITTVPRTDPYILGVINLRGKVIPVVDLRVRFELDRSDFDKKTRIIVVKFEKENIGFVVDEVTEVIRIDKSIVEPTPPLVGAVGQEYILGICKYQKRLIILLDIDRVVYDDDSLASDLRKKIINAQDKQTGVLEHSAEEEDLENGGTETEIKDVEELIVEEKQQDKFELTERDDSEAVDNEVTKLEDHADEIDDIDKLIAIELAKREQETEELLKKKKDVDKTEAAIDPVEDILNDALNQANSKISPEVSHVDQDDLDRLIAEELAKREKETEELLRRKKEEEKKKINESETEQLEAKTEEKKDEIVIERDSLKELKDLASKIINGETKDIDINIKGEIGELLKLLIDTKDKLDVLEPSVEDSSKDVPFIAKTLENVNDYTEKATLNLMEAADKMSGFFSELNESMSNIEKIIQKGDMEKFELSINEVESRLAEAENLGFNILQALEFQDITEQKARKVIKKVEEIGVRLGTILGYAKIQSTNAGAESQASQEDIDKLLGEFGLS